MRLSNEVVSFLKTYKNWGSKKIHIILVKDLLHKMKALKKYLISLDYFRDYKKCVNAVLLSMDKDGSKDRYVNFIWWV